MTLLVLHTNPGQKRPEHKTHYISEKITENQKNIKVILNYLQSFFPLLKTMHFVYLKFLCISSRTLTLIFFRNQNLIFHHFASYIIIWTLKSFDIYTLKQGNINEAEITHCFHLMVLHTNPGQKWRKHETRYISEKITKKSEKI